MDVVAAYFYPNRMGRIILNSLIEIVGAEQAGRAVEAAGLAVYLEQLPPNDLELAFPFAHVSQLQAAVEQQFGVEEGRDINRRVGRACLNGGLHQFNPLLGIADLPTRAMPLGLKLNIGFDMFAMVFNRFTDQIVKVSEDSHHYLWIIERCPVCWGRQTEHPCCDLAVGILEEATAWATGGRAFEVQQVTCVAMGHENCTIHISKRPMR
jgi:predicted hydrocarbon binding protein